MSVLLNVPALLWLVAIEDSTAPHLMYLASHLSLASLLDHYPPYVRDTADSCYPL